MIILWISLIFSLVCFLIAATLGSTNIRKAFVWFQIFTGIGIVSWLFVIGYTAGMMFN